MSKPNSTFEMYACEKVFYPELSFSTHIKENSNMVYHYFKQWN